MNRYIIRTLSADTTAPAIATFKKEADATRAFIATITSASTLAPNINKVQLIKDATREYRVLMTWTRGEPTTTTTKEEAGI